MSKLRKTIGLLVSFLFLCSLLSMTSLDVVAQPENTYVEHADTDVTHNKYKKRSQHSFKKAPHHTKKAHGHKAPHHTKKAHGHKAPHHTKKAPHGQRHHQHQYEEQQ